MRISGLNSFYGLPKNHKQILNLQESKITSIQKENFSTLPSDAWKAHRLTNINKINFLGNDSEKTNPIYIFLGPPLAGKGTTAKLMSQKKNIPLIGVGAILRENVAKGTELGKIAKSYMDSGELMPSDIVMSIIEERIDKEDCQNGFIFDGFPRKVNEAQDFVDIIKRKNKEGKNYSIKVINFLIDEDVLLDRAEKRRVKENRTDDTPQTVKHRIKVYYEKTKPVEKLFENMGILTNIDTKSKVGNETSEEDIFAKVLEATEE